MDARGLDPAAFLRQNLSGVDLHEVLRRPVEALAGVSADAVAALEPVGVRTVFDLAASSLFALAQAAAAVTESALPPHRLGVTPGDWLEPGTAVPTAADIPSLPVAALRGVGAERAAALTAALGVSTIQDLARWPPRLVAQALLGAAIGTEPGDVAGEEPSAEALRPRMGMYPTERVYYDHLAMLHMDEGASLRRPLEAPVSLSPAVSPGFAFDRIAVGALLTYAQSWYAEGVTLGQLLHSLALAPGEATRIAVIDWSRRTSALTSESIAESEQLDNTATHARALSEVQNAVATEMQQGSSTTSGWTEARSTASAGSGSSGIVESVLFGSSSGSTSEQEASTRFGARSSSWSQGNRSVTANLEQHVNDRTEQHAASVRNRRTSAVREVSQTEHENVSTRIVANYNHMHALTVQYFEVAQLYRTRTALHRSERCLFVPMQYPDFGGPDAMELVQRFRGALLGAALTARARDLLADDSTSVTVHPVRPPGVILVDPIVAVPATQVATRAARRARGARLRPVEAVHAASEKVAATVSGAEPDDPAAGEAPAGKPAPVSATSAWAWEPAVISRAVHLIGRPILRPGAADARLPEEAVLIGIEFDGIDARAVQLERVGSSAAESTHDVPAGLSALDFLPGIRLDELTGIRIAKAAHEPASGSLTLKCSIFGREFRTPRLTVSLGQGTGLSRIVRLESDRADRQVELLEHLQANAPHYGQAIIRSFDAATIVGLLAPFTWNGRPLVEVVEPTPVTVAGNFLVLRAPVDAGEDAGVGGKTWAQLLEDLGAGSRTDERLVPVATGGVFAEAVLGRSNSAEKLDITRFWNWMDSPTPLTPPEIEPVGTGTRATPEDLKPGQLGPPVVNITNPTSLPDPAGLGAVLNAVTAANAFRDMSGLAGTQQLAQSAVGQTVEAATAAGQMANETLRAEIQRQMAEMQLAADVAKAAMGIPPVPNDTAGISGEGAKINQGKSLDDRGVPVGDGDTGGDGSSGGKASSSGRESMDTGSTDQMPTSREARAFDQATHRFSPDALEDLRAKLTRASFPGSNGGGGGSGSRPSPDTPEHVTEFENILKKTLPEFKEDPVIQAVKVEDLAAKVDFFDLRKNMQSTYMAGIFGAWTDSATKIFVGDPWTPERKLSDEQITDSLTITAIHEAVHLHDFARTGRPQTYAQMMDYESNAYGATRDWLDSDQAKKLLSDQQERVNERTASDVYAKEFQAQIARVRGLSAAAKEAAFKNFLLGKNRIRQRLREAKILDPKKTATDSRESEILLPPHNQIAELYGP